MAQTREEYNAYMRQYLIARYYRRKAEAEVVLGGACARCGGAEDLQFDHKDPASKSFTIAKLWSVSEGRFWTEITKCQLLCAPCHKEKTRSEQSVEHGGGASGKKNCRCTPCRSRKAEYMKTYMKTYERAGSSGEK